MNYYERHIGDYLKDTAHLSLMEHGVYGRLLDVYYTRETGIEQANAARLIGARSKEERAALESVLSEFFSLCDGIWTHGRCEREIARYQDKQRKASASANARWKKGETHTDGNADGMRTHMRTHSEGNAPNHQTPDTSLVPKVQTEKAQPASRGQRLPPDWTPAPEHMAFAEGLGLTNGKAAAELEKFRDYFAGAPGQKGVKTDWPATWRNWVRRVVEDGATGKQSRSDPWGGAQ